MDHFNTIRGNTMRGNRLQDENRVKIRFNKGILWAFVMILLLVCSTVNFFGIHPFRDSLEKKLLDEAESRIEIIRKGTTSLDFGVGNASAPVYIRQLSHDFRFGANCFQFGEFSTEYLNQLYNESFQSLFNYATLPFYWDMFEPTQGVYPYRYRMHNMTEWLETFNGTAKGHPIVWQSNYPPWLTEKDESENETIVLNRIEYLLNEYPEIKVWDLVNEMIHVNNSWLGDTPVETWEVALEKARSVRDDCEFIINEYDIIDSGNASKGFGPPKSYYDLIKQIIEDNYAPDAIGFQFHSTYKWQPLQDIVDTLDTFGDFKIPCQITEFIPASKGYYYGGSRRGVITEFKQAEYAKIIYKMLFSHPAINTITWWDFSDTENWGAWKADSGAYMMTQNGRLLPVYTTLYDLIHVEWNSTMETSLDENGRLKFSGFYGNYTISIDGGDPISFNITDTRTAENKPWKTTDIELE
ncbi:MAG: hypothetical protein GF364_15540 [Candidatus Lokiarchaeota archaeon]|nr:hypothetical protein [Candidatus Lokiarchaeota archaeon]